MLQQGISSRRPCITKPLTPLSGRGRHLHLSIVRMLPPGVLKEPIARLAVVHGKREWLISVAFGVLHASAVRT